MRYVYSLNPLKRVNSILTEQGLFEGRAQLYEDGLNPLKRVNSILTQKSQGRRP